MHSLDDYGHHMPALTFADLLGWATTAVEQVARVDRVEGDRPDANGAVRRDRALATVLAEVVEAQARQVGLGPSATARQTIRAMLGVPGRRPAVDVPPDLAEAGIGVLGTIHETVSGLALTDDDRLEDPDGSRKAAGAYYTPPSVIEILLDHTLTPVLDDRDTAVAIAGVRVLDPACGSGHFLDAAMVRIAAALEKVGTDPTVARTTAARCVLGVDVDPVAVVLARLGLWLRAADRALPPTAFSGQVALGDALAGARVGEVVDVHEAMFEPGPDDDRRESTARRKRWRALEDDDPGIVERAMSNDLDRTLDTLASLWHAPKVPGAPDPVEVLAQLAGGSGSAATRDGDRDAAALVDELVREHRPLHWPLDVPQSSSGFDVVVGNPPYVKSRAHGRANPGLRRRLTRTRPECRGGQWNLYVPFVALGADLLRPGGRSALLVPNSVVAADFAGPLQEHVADRVVEVLDFTEADLFDQASVHVAALVTTAAPVRDPVTFVRHTADLGIERSGPVDRELLARLPDGYWCLPLLGHSLDTPMDRLVELLGADRTIGDIATARDGCSTNEAYALKPLLAEDGTVDDRPTFRFANTGTIDPDRFLWGEREAVYLGEKYLHPVVPVAALEADFPKRAVEATSPKVLLAGLSARLEAVADQAGEWLCGKSAVQVLVDHPDEAVRLAAWLNRPELSDLYRALFGLAGFGGKGMNVAPALVSRLPAPPDDWRPSDA